MTVTGDAVITGTIDASNMGAGVDNSVVILDSDGVLKTDEIDSRVWGSSLVDRTGTPVNNQLAIWTDQNTVEGDESLTFDASVNELGLGGYRKTLSAYAKNMTTGTSTVLAITGLDANDIGAIYFYTVRNTSGAQRTGMFMVSRDHAGNVTFADSSTSDLGGSTAAFKFGVSDTGTGGTLTLQGVVTSGTWSAFIDARVIG